MNESEQHVESQESKFNESGASQMLSTMLTIAMGMVISYFLINTGPTIINRSTKFDEILRIINDQYVDSINVSGIENQAVNSLLGLLDPHSIYIPKEDLIQSNEPLEGNFDGIGIEFYIVNDTLVVVAPIAGGPAELAGIKTGDKILKINDTVVAGVGLKNADVYRKLRGERGTTVKLTIMNATNNQVIPIVVKRNKIEVKSVEKSVLIDPQTGYIKINSFGEKTYQEFYDELKSLVKDKSIQNLVLDLRQNTGGYLEVAVNILDELIDQNKLLVYTKGRNFPLEKYISQKQGLFESGNLIVLIDEGSASASEILAGAVQDLDRGYIVGRRSFGKGLVQSQINLSDGSAIRLTVAKYYTPSGRNIQKPYSNGLDEYQKDILHRYQKGEFFTQDSVILNDTTKYYTSKGRLVKSGGGIFPDYFVPLDTNFDIHNFSLYRSIVPDFVYTFQNTFIPDPTIFSSLKDFDHKFVIDAKMMKSFYNYAKQKNLNANNSKNHTYESKLKNLIKSYFAKILYKSEGFQYIANQNDPFISKSIEILKKNKPINLN